MAGEIFAIALRATRRTLCVVSIVTRSDTRSTAADALPGRAEITRAAAGIGVYAGLFGLAFGAVAAAAGLSVLQSAALSAVMFTGASQFALVGILAVAGSPARRSRRWRRRCCWASAMPSTACPSPGSCARAGSVAC
jgi:hypothetical protein